ncbi:MAG: ImmA/IrrE family metallo-endopeptidase [Ilumatobacteraceae bacterium]
MASEARRPTLDTVTEALIELVAPYLDDLATEDPSAAVETYFEPVAVKSLPSARLTSGDCSVDGFYESNVDPARPWILYAADVVAERARFTILHELGHHLLNTTAAHLLDDIDMLGATYRGAVEAEEAVCHRFAGKVLIPQGLVDSMFAGDVPVPREIAALHERSMASWEAVAVRAAEAARRRAAVILIRDPGHVGFAATSSRMPAGWPRGSQFQASGPLSRALNVDHQRAIKDCYRWELPHAEQLYCDTVRVHDQLAIAVLSDKPSDGHFDILEEVEPSWKSKEEFCLRCGEERNVGWCGTCSGRYCSGCGSCGCNQPINNPVCPRCFLANPHRPGASICVGCEADLE